MRPMIRELDFAVLVQGEEEEEEDDDAGEDGAEGGDVDVEGVVGVVGVVVVDVIITCVPSTGKSSNSSSSSSCAAAFCGWRGFCWSVESETVALLVLASLEVDAPDILSERDRVVFEALFSRYSQKLTSEDERVGVVLPLQVLVVVGDVGE